MSIKTINTNQLTPGKLILVRGFLDYCHITKPIAGEELRKANERNKAHGWNTKDKPYTKATIRNASVVMTDPSNPTLEEQFAVEHLYKSVQTPEKQFCYNAENSGNNLPWVGVLRTGTTNVVDQIKPEGELAAGLDVTLVLRVYKPKNQINNGVSLDGVIVNEPVRYYENNTLNVGLNELGITFNALPNEDIGIPAQETTPVAPEQPYTAYSPATPVAPAPQPSAVPNEPFTVQPTTNPYAVPPQTNPQPNGGIRYNPADRNY